MSNAVLTSIISLNANNNRDLNVGLRQQKSAEKISPNAKINHTTGAAAGISISEKARMETIGVEQLDKNSQDGMSLTQAADSAIHEMQNIVQNMENLTIRINDATPSEIEALELEINQLALELESIVESREFNGTPLLDAGTDLEDNAVPNNITIQNGVNPEEKLVISLPNFNTGVKQPGPVVNLILEHVLFAQDTRPIEERLYSIEGAFLELSTVRSDLVIIQNKIEESINNSQLSFESGTRETSEVEARIRDTDMAHDVLSQTRLSMLESSSVAMLAQANQAPQAAQQLLE